MENCFKGVLFLGLTLVLGCGQKAAKENVKKIENTTRSKSVGEIPIDSIFNDKGERIIFKASGNEPFWGVEISEKNMVFTSLTGGLESFNAPYQEPVRAMDANIKTYVSKQGIGTIRIVVTQIQCTDDMSGKESSYQVKVHIVRPTDPDGMTFSGCGNYSTDYRLNDLWILEAMKGKKMKRENFAKDIPYMEINTSENTFMGYAGCNRMHGTIFNEGPLLRFSQIALTRMMCGTGNQETEFIENLQSSNEYSLENNRLSLVDPEGNTLVFKKVD